MLAREQLDNELIETLRACGVDTGPATYVAPTPEDVVRPFAGGAAAAPVGWQLPSSSWPLLRFAPRGGLEQLEQRARGLGLSSRVLYELQVLRDAGALLPPEVDAPLIEDLAAVAGRHGGGELDRRGYGEAQVVRGEAQVVRLLRRVLARAWEAGPRAEVRSRDEIRSGLRELRESGERRAPPPGGAVL